MYREELKDLLRVLSGNNAITVLEAWNRILEEFDRLWGMETLCANALKDTERFKKWWVDDHEWNILLKEEIETLQRVADWFQALSEERTKHIAGLERENQELDAEVVACMSTFDATMDDLQPKAEALERICEPLEFGDKTLLRHRSHDLQMSDGEGWAIGETVHRICDYLDSQQKPCFLCGRDRILRKQGEVFACEECISKVEHNLREHRKPKKAEFEPSPVEIEENPGLGNYTA